MMLWWNTERAMFLRRAIVVNIIYTYLLTVCVQPDLYVSQTGKSSVVSILPPDHIKGGSCGQCSAVQGPPTLSAVDSSIVSSRPRTDFAHDVYNSHVLTSNLVRAHLTSPYISELTVSWLCKVGTCREHRRVNAGCQGAKPYSTLLIFSLQNLEQRFPNGVTSRVHSS